jgi:hypothetical protein
MAHPTDLKAKTANARHCISMCRAFASSPMDNASANLAPAFGHIAEWVKLTDLKSVQVDPKSKTDTNPRGSGRQEGGVNAASRELG